MGCTARQKLSSPSLGRQCHLGRAALKTGRLFFSATLAVKWLERCRATRPRLLSGSVGGADSCVTKRMICGRRGTVCEVCQFTARAVCTLYMYVTAVLYVDPSLYKFVYIYINISSLIPPWATVESCGCVCTVFCLFICFLVFFPC